MSIPGETTRRAKSVFAARTKLTFAAFLAALLGLGVAPHAALAVAIDQADAQLRPTDAPPEREAPREKPADQGRHGGSTRYSQQGEQSLPTSTIAGTLPQAPREHHAPGGSAGVVSPAGSVLHPPTGHLVAISHTDDKPAGTGALALPEVRGPPPGSFR